MFLQSFLAASIGAADSGDPTQFTVVYDPKIPIESTERSEILVERFLQEVSTSDGVVFDRFLSPSSQLYWARKRESLGYGALDRLNSDGAGLFATIGMDSLRTAAAAALPFESWQDQWHGWFGDFISGTIGNPEEEHITLTSISYSAVRTYWETDDSSSGLHYGIRPWRTNPYVYVLTHAGHWEGRPLLTFEGRAGYALFGVPQIEGRVTLQLPSSFRFGGGIGINPARLSSNDPSAMHASITLERVLYSRELVPKGVFYLGFRLGSVSTPSSTTQQESLIVAGFAKSW
jgi:hypothetical protein